MRIRHLRAVLVAAVVLPLAACASGDAAASPDGGGAASTTAEASATPDGSAEDADVDLEALLLGVADIPTGGWRVDETSTDGGGSEVGGTDDGGTDDVAESPEVSTDKQSLGACFLDLSGDLPELVDGTLGGRSFVRDTTGSQLVHGYATSEDPHALLRGFETVMAACDEPQNATSSGQSRYVRSEKVEPAGLPAEDTTCRHFETAIGYHSLYGHLCLVAVDDLVLMQTTMSPFPEVPEEEVVALLNAAVDKARG